MRFPDNKIKTITYVSSIMLPIVLMGLINNKNALEVYFGFYYYLA